MNTKRQPKKKKTSKNNNFVARLKPLSKDAKQSTPLLICKQLGGFPAIYRWIYRVAFTNSAFPISVNTSTSLLYGFNWPQSQFNLGWIVLGDVYDSYVIRGSTFRARVYNKSTTVGYRVNLVPFNTNTLTTVPFSSDNVLVDNPFAVTTDVSVVTSNNIAEVQSSQMTHKVAGLQKPVDEFADSYDGFIGGANSNKAFTKPGAILLGAIYIVT
jgi:hypothetical protein